MKKTKYITPSDVENIATYQIASIGSCFDLSQKIYGTITYNQYGAKYNTKDVSIMLYTPEFWSYWEFKSKKDKKFYELYADKLV